MKIKNSVCIVFLTLISTLSYADIIGAHVKLIASNTNLPNGLNVDFKIEKISGNFTSKGWKGPSSYKNVAVGKSVGPADFSFYIEKYTGDMLTAKFNVTYTATATNDPSTKITESYPITITNPGSGQPITITPIDDLKKGNNIHCEFYTSTDPKNSYLLDISVGCAH